MEGAESGRSSASGTATIGDRETIMGYYSDQEMEDGITAGPSTPNVPGYGDLKIIYAIVRILYMLWERLTGRHILSIYSIRQAD